MIEMTPHEMNIIRMQMAFAKDKIVSDYKERNKDDRFSKKVINDYQRILDKLGKIEPK
ncbi:MULTISPECIES: hypothetical protein [unclassified Planococcus (in: firmicutes)]|uniref:hypothetical protein n=1 Tax=unclassified Planococcus (in: firmicutes) TaxID=2662419 RepID=UPI0015E13B5A|nr:MULTISPECIES: hypothetical protein [unclassified Planococcus (in: firmicutes)]